MDNDVTTRRGVPIDVVGTLLDNKARCLERVRLSHPSEWAQVIAGVLTEAWEVGRRAGEPSVFTIITYEIAIEVESCLHSGMSASSMVERLFGDAQQFNSFDTDALRSLLRRSVRGWLTAAPPHDVVNSVRVERTAEFIRAHLAEKLTAQTLSRASGSSPQCLNRVFRGVFGLSLHEYVVQTRIRRAIELLLVGEKVSAVIAQVGYRNKTSFNRAFEAITGTMPGTFRRSEFDRPQRYDGDCDNHGPVNASRAPG